MDTVLRPLCWRALGCCLAMPSKQASDLASLSRQQLQQRAKEAGIKANQSTEILIRELSKLLTPGSQAANSRRSFGVELSASKANQPLASRRLLRTLSEDDDSVFLCDSPPHDISLACSRLDGQPTPRVEGMDIAFSPIVGRRLSCCSSIASLTSSPAAAQLEMNTFDFTVARLKALGFADEDAEWAANQARARQAEGLDLSLNPDESLCLDMSSLCIVDKKYAKIVSRPPDGLHGKALELVLASLNTWDISTLTVAVSREWRAASVTALQQYHTVDSEEYADRLYEEGPKRLNPPASVHASCFEKKFPWGRFLAVGGFKQVFLAYNAEDQRQEAISVMDLSAMAENGNLCVAETEIRIAFLLEQLAKSSPHFVTTFQTLRCDLPPPTLWGNEENKKPQGTLQEFLHLAKTCPAPKTNRAAKRKTGNQKVKTGDFQYIRMEYCTEGDVEEVLRSHPHPPAEAVASLMFQMASALHVFQGLHMRHYDVKLLNFFLTKRKAADDLKTANRETGEFWGASNAGAWLVKLADFGTADVDQSTFDDELTERQVTTWENVLPAFLLFGNMCKRDSSADVHGLALCFLHLLLGDAPYEEAVQDLTCPPKLGQKWKSVWMGEVKSKGRATKLSTIYNCCPYMRFPVTPWTQKQVKNFQYHALLNLLAPDPEETLLEDTLYRNIVIFGVEDVENAVKSEDSGPILDALVDFVRGPGRDRWREDVDRFSLLTQGEPKNEKIAKARQVLDEIDGGQRILRGLSDIFGVSRISYADVMEAFAAYDHN